MVAMPSAAGAKAVEVLLTTPSHKASKRGWLQPFEVDWMLCAIYEAQTDNATHAALGIWVHQEQFNKITDKLLIKLRKGDKIAREQLYELREPICYVR